jgi:hypothetical protein
MLELFTPKQVDVSVGQKQGPLYYEFLEHISRLTPEDVQKVFDFAASLPRHVTTINAELLQLGDGSHE